MSLAQLMRTMHNICKVRCSNPDHHKKSNNTSWNLIKYTEARTGCGCLN